VILTAAERAFLADARTATLATIDPDGLPRLVPICFVLSEADGAAPVLYSPLDEKPKAVADPRSLARVRDILARPDVAVLVDRWSDDWTELAWLRAAGRATLLEPDGVPTGTIEGLRAKYPQYETHRLESRPLLRITLERITTWGAV
jgi:PPOX class probable F420-dependent enzyme